MYSSLISHIIIATLHQSVTGYLLIQWRTRHVILPVPYNSSINFNSMECLPYVFGILLLISRKPTAPLLPPRQGHRCRWFSHWSCQILFHLILYHLLHHHPSIKSQYSVHLCHPLQSISAIWWLTMKKVKSLLEKTKRKTRKWTRRNCPVSKFCCPFVPPLLLHLPHNQRFPVHQQHSLSFPCSKSTDQRNISDIAFQFLRRLHCFLHHHLHR